MIEAKRILIVEVNWLGDVLFSTPFIRAVRNNFPGAYIACMVVPRCKEVLAGNPNINEIIYYDVGANGRSPLQSFFENIKIIKQLKRYGFDTAFLLHRSFTRTLLVFLAGIPNRIGYYVLKRALLLTHKPMPPKVELHRAEFYLGILKAVGLKTEEKGCDFYINQEDVKGADNFLRLNRIKENERMVIFNPGGNWDAKRWPKENFAALGKKILDFFGDDVKIILTGAEKDCLLCQDICRSIIKNTVAACGKLTLKETGALFKKADLVISGDSGPLHLAVAAGAKAIGLFGPTHPDITGPYKADKDKVIVLRKGTGCKIPCYDANCRDYKCMAAIIPDEVFEAVKQMLKSNRNTIDIQ